MVDVKAHVHALAAVELRQGLLLQAVGVVVGGEAENGILPVARLLQVLEGILQGTIQLHLAGQVRPRRLAETQVGHLILMLGGHGIAHVVIVHVAADGHVVGVEGRVPHVLRQGQLHHLKIRFRPGLLHLQAVAHALVVVAHVGVGDVPVVVGVAVVMVGTGAVAQGAELVAQAEVELVAAGAVQRPAAGLGDEPRADGVLPVGGGGPPEGVIEVLKDEAGVGQPVEGGGHVLPDSEAGEALRREEDQVLPGEVPGILILPGGCPGGEPFVHPPERGVVALHQCLKVDGHDVVAVDVGLRLRDLRRLLRRGAAGGRCRGGIRRRAAAPGDAQELAEVQPEGGEDAEALHRLLRDELLPVEVAGGDGPPVIPADQQHRQKLHRRRDAHRQGHGPPGDAALRQQPPSPEEVESAGGQDHEKWQPGPGHAAQGLPPELQHLSRAPHGVEGQEGVEDGEVDRLGPQPEGTQHRQDASGGAPSPAGAEGAEEIRHPAEGQREEDGIAEAALRAEGIEVDGQLLHGEHCREPQPEEPGWDFPFLPFSARHGGSPFRRARPAPGLWKPL